MVKGQTKEIDLHANDRRLTLCGWVKNNAPSIYDNPIKLQQFLFLYECFSKVAGKKSDFTNLMGNKHMVFFQDVWNDYTQSKDVFDKVVNNAIAYESN